MRIATKYLPVALISTAVVFYACATQTNTAPAPVAPAPASENQPVSVTQDTTSNQNVSPNPNTAPRLTVRIPALFSPNPDITSNRLPIQITVSHPAPIKDWNIEIQPNRREYIPVQVGTPRQDLGRDATGKERRWVSFYEESGTGTPPAEWVWNGRTATGELVQSAGDYAFILSVNDIYDNNAVYEGTINVDVLVRQEGENYRIVVSDILFPPNSSNFTLLKEEERAANTRIMERIAYALNRFPDYRVTIYGHANPTTPPDTVQRTTEEAGTATIMGLRPLSEARAKAVADYLVQNGHISANRLTVRGMGGAYTIAPYNDVHENWKNRRVECFLQK